ncbi:MAG: glycosyltransferase family 39 protein [Anaerolineales bacterium]|nr:glycosyltransferase family 39 protein [Anaerolineales bacterium]
MARPSAQPRGGSEWRAGLWPALAVAVVLAAAALRAAPLLANRFHPDEALYASFARRIASGQDPLLAGALVDKPPLPFYVSALSLLAVGPTELGARLPSYFAGVVSVALAARLGRRLYGRATGLLAAALLAASPFAVLFASTAFIDPLLAAAGLWALDAAAAGRWKGAGAALAVAFAIKQTALLYAPLALALALWRLPARADGRTGRRALAQAAGPLLAGLALTTALVFAWDAARRPEIGFWQQGYSDNMPGRWVRAGEVLPRARAWLDLLGYGTASAVLNGLLVVGAPALVLWPAPASRAALADRLLAGYLLLYLAAYWLLAFNVWDRYLLPVLPLALLLLARVIVVPLRWVTRRAGHWRRWIVAGAAAGLLGVTAGPAWAAARSAYPIGGDHGAYDGVDGAAAYLNSLPEGTVLYDHWLSWEWGFYLYGGPVYVAWLPTPEALAADLQAFGARSPRYLAAPSWEPEAEWRAAAAEAGYAFAPVYTAYRRDGAVTIRVYRLEAAP